MDFHYSNGLLLGGVAFLSNLFWDPDSGVIRVLVSTWERVPVCEFFVW